MHAIIRPLATKSLTGGQTCRQPSNTGPTWSSSTARRRVDCDRRRAPPNWRTTLDA